MPRMPPSNSAIGASVSRARLSGSRGSGKRLGRNKASSSSSSSAAAGAASSSSSGAAKPDPDGSSGTGNPRQQKTSSSLMRAGARARSTNKGEAAAAAAPVAAPAPKKARHTRIKPKAVKRKGPVPKNPNRVKPEPPEVVLSSASGGGRGGRGGHGAGASRSSVLNAAGGDNSRRSRVNSVGDAKQSSPIRKQARQIAIGVQARRNAGSGKGSSSSSSSSSSASASASASSTGRRRKLTESQQRAALLKSEASARLKKQTSGDGEWPPTVGKSGQSVFVPTSLPFLSRQEDRDDSALVEDEEPSADPSTSSSSPAAAPLTVNNSERCHAFARLHEEGTEAASEAAAAATSGNRIMLLQIPHLPHSKVLDFGAPVMRRKAEKRNTRKGKAAAQHEDEVVVGGVPLVGSAFPSTDKFTGSGATTTIKPLEQSVRRAGEGLIGKMRVRASGKVELVLGGIPMRVIDGPTCGTYQELVYLQGQGRSGDGEGSSGAAATGGSGKTAAGVVPLAERPTMCFLGPVENRVTVVPDVAWLLKNRL
jgi:hypothetical protein